MKSGIIPAISAVIGLVVAACSLPQVGLGSAGTPAATAASGTAGSPSQLVNTVTNDPARGVAVFTALDGTKVDVTAPDPTSGQSVTCIQSVGYSVVSTPGSEGPLPGAVFVVGERSDGAPGIWEIDSGRHVRLLDRDGSGRKGDLNPESSEAPERLYRHLGWVYHVVAISADGKMIVGYAENPKGFGHGALGVPAGTTVGIYWRVYDGFKGHRFVSPPSVIGTWDAPKKLTFPHHHGFFSFLSSLKLFFLGRLQSYLIMTTGVDYDSSLDAYVVAGTDQDGNDAQATIFKNGSIDIKEVQTPPPTTTYSEIVVDTFYPTGTTGNGFNFDVIGLFDSTGVAASADPWSSPTTGTLAVDGQSGTGSNPNSGQTFYAYIDYKPATPLPSGTVLYVRINGYSPTGLAADAATGDYGIRVLAAPSASYTYFTSLNPTDSPYEPDDTPTFGGTPTTPATITLGSQGLDRSLSSGDVDWVKITLP